VTLTAAEVVVFPAASRATAVRVCAPLLAVAVFHESAYGAVVTSAPRGAPSSWNCTPTTRTLSVALAATVTVPAIGELAAGAVTVTDGGAVAAGGRTPTPARLLPRVPVLKWAGTAADWNSNPAILTVSASSAQQ